MDKDNNNNNNGGGVINLTDKINQMKAANNPSKDELYDIQEAFELALATFEETLEGAVGFITITFDKGGQPSIVHAGELDLLKTVGTLDFIKNELLNNVPQFSQRDIEVFQEDPETSE